MEKLPKDVKLPKGILKSDLKYPTKNHAYDEDFELWYTSGFGWCIPTLLIGKARYGNGQYGNRTYATTLDGRAVRIGNGPHVKARVTVYMKKSRQKALRKFLDIKEKGAEVSHTIRDRISTRRARSALRWY